MRSTKFSVIKKAVVGKDSRIHDQVNLYGCKIGENTKIDSYVYIEEGVTIGDNCKIRPFVFIPTGVVIENDVFIAPNVTFTNDKHPRAHGEWTLLNTRVKKYASIGAGSTINPGYREIGKSGAVIERFSPQSVDEICLILDDPDVTILGEIDESRKRTEVPVTIIENLTRNGIGFAIKEGYRYALSHRFDLIVVMAGNGKDDPREIPRLTGPIYKT